MVQPKSVCLAWLLFPILEKAWFYTTFVTDVMINSCEMQVILLAIMCVGYILKSWIFWAIFFCERGEILVEKKV